MSFTTFIPMFKTLLSTALLFILTTFSLSAADEITLTFANTNLCAGTTYDVTYTSNMEPGTLYKLQLFKSGIETHRVESTSNPIAFTIPKETISGNDYSIKLSSGIVEAAPLGNISLTNMANVHLRDQYGFGLYYSYSICPNATLDIDATLYGPISFYPTQPLTGTFTYQWQKDNMNIANTTNSISITQAGNYKLIVTQNSCSFQQQFPVFSSNAANPQINFDSSPKYFCEGSTIKIIAKPIANSATFQWQKDSFDIPDATTRELTVTTSGNYRLKIIDSNCANVGYSNNANINFGDALHSNIQATNKVLCGNDPILNNVTISPIGPFFDYFQDLQYPLSFKYQKNGVDIPNSEGKLRLKISEPGIYRMITTQGNCIATSNELQITQQNQFAAPLLITLNGVPNPVPDICTGVRILLWNKNGNVYKDNILVARNTNTYETNSSGVYKLVYGEGTSCIVESNPEIVNFDVLNPKIIVDKTNICGPNDYTFMSFNSAFINGEFTYQWQKDRQDIPWQTGSAFAIFGLGTAGAYRLKVINGNCTAYSDEVIVTNNSTENFTIKTLDDESANLACSNRLLNISTLYSFANNSSSLKQWYRNNTILPGETGSSLNSALAGDYKLVITNTGCTATSNIISINSDYVPQPVLTQSPTQVGASATLTASACNGTINWYDAAIGGNLLGTSTSYATPNLSSTQPYFADCTTTACKSARERIDVVLDGCTSMYTLRSGSWYEPTTWSCGRIPIASDQITINAGHEISITYGDPTIKTLQHAGSLMLKNDAKLTLVE